MKKKLICILLFSLSICLLPACGKSISNEELPIERIEGTYLVDVNDPVALMSSADYAFIAKVVKKNGCEYMDGERPYTNYVIRIIENIKGELRTDIDIPIIKMGGLAVDGSCYEVYEDDILPEEGDVCIFTAYGTEEGGLSVGGANSTQLLEVTEEFLSAIESNEGDISVASEIASDEISDGISSEDLENAGNEEEYIEEVLEMNDVYNEFADASEKLLPPEEVETVELEHYTSQFEK